MPRMIDQTYVATFLYLQTKHFVRMRVLQALLVETSLIFIEFIPGYDGEQVV